MNAAVENTEAKRPTTSNIDEVAQEGEYLKYRDGVKLSNGETINQLIAKSKSYAIFTIKDSYETLYETTTDSDTIREQLQELNIVETHAIIKFNGMHIPSINEAHTSVLTSIFHTQSESIYQKALENYSEIIELTPRTKSVIADNKRFQVWIDERNDIRFATNNLGKETTPCTKELHKTISLAKSLLSKSAQEKYYKKIILKVATAFADALSRPDNSSTDDIFGAIRANIIKTAENDLRLRYISGITASSIALITIAYLAFQCPYNPIFLHTVLIPMAGGCLGTFLSVLSRSNRIILSENELDTLIIGEGVIRIMLGASFGLVAYLLASSDIAFTIFNKNNLALLLLGVLAGFSERLVPDMLENLSTEQKKADQSKDTKQN